MVIEWISDALAKGAFAAALLALAGWLFKQQISAWLNQDLERRKATYLQELEAKKFQYQQDLEIYRVSLIAAAERSKAEAEIKKAGALRIVEKRFAAFDRLHSAVVDTAVECLRVAQLTYEQKTNADAKLILARLSTLRDAAGNVEIFLSSDERNTLLKYRNELLEAVEFSTMGTPPPSQDVMKQLQLRLFAVEYEVDQFIKLHVDRMMTMSS